LLFTRRVFQQLEPWDERFFLYYEDADIGLRASKSGTIVWLESGHNWLHGRARETTQLKFGPWRREIASMAIFYMRYPDLLLPRKLALLRSVDFRKMAASLPNLSEYVHCVELFLFNTARGEQISGIFEDRLIAPSRKGPERV
jgi:GT2 family glycosyltransferase